MTMFSRVGRNTNIVTIPYIPPLPTPQGALALAQPNGWAQQHDNELYVHHHRKIVQPVIASGLWLGNLPPALASGLLTDNPFNLAIDTVPFGSPDANGWAEANNNHSPTRGTIVSDSSAPQSPNNVVQFFMEAGFSGGIAPFTYYFSHSNKKHVYACFVWKPSSPFQSHPSGVNKILFWFTASNADCGMIMQGANPGKLIVFTEYPSDVRHLTGNINNPDVVLGAYHYIELEMVYASSNGASDGTAKWWMDGLQIGSYSDITTPSDAGFNNYEFSPTWGGTNSTVSADQYHRLDEAAAYGI